MSLGQIAYEAYFEMSGGVSLVSGAELPKWELLNVAIQDAWEAAAEAVKDEVSTWYPPDSR